MTKQVETEPEGRKSVNHVLFLSALLLLPGAIWALLGWVCGLIPLITFIFISKFGWSYTNKKFIIAILTATCASLFLQNLEMTLFTVMLVPTGYAVAHSAEINDEPWLAGLKAVLTLTVSLFVFFGLLLINSEISFFTALTESFNRAIEETLSHYQQNGSLSSDNFLILEQTFYQIKYIAPMVMPAILSSMIIMVSWVTIALGNTILIKLDCKQSWSKYRYWNLPDKLIWGLILSGILALTPEETIRIIGINGLIIIGLLYCIQGLAILVFLVNKWQIPRMLRTAIYIIMVLQSFGTIVLLGIGIADVWLDFRRQPTEQINDKKETE